MAETSTETPPAVDPFTSELIKSIGLVLPPKKEEEGGKKTEEPISTAPGGEETPVRENVTIGEWASHVKKNAKTPEELKAEADAAELAAQKAAEEAAKQKTDPTAAPVQAQQPPKRIVVRRKADLPPAPELPPVPVTIPAKAEETDETYINGLQPEQQEVIELARYAEAKGKKGILKETIQHFRAVDKYIEEHPDADPEGEEFQKAIEATQPNWNPAERRKMERSMIAEQAAAAARQTLDPIVKQQQDELRRLQTQPLIDDAVDVVAQAMVAGIDTGDPNNKFEPVSQEVIDCIRNEGYDAAVRKYRVEAPIVQGALSAAQRWMEVAKGLRRFNPADETDAWLINFINEQGAIMAQKPKPDQLDRAGRTFMPLTQYLGEVRKNKQDTERKFWTFSTEMVRDMIASQAVIALTEEYKLMEASGFKRVPKVSAPPGTGAPGGTAGGGGPRAGGSQIPGAGETAEQLSEYEQFIETLVPGAGKEFRKKK